MKKIDLHLHTVATVSDRHFDFSSRTLIEYVSTASIDAIAITNHNTFDHGQYEEIRKSLFIAVFPGIEVDLEGCHVLLITNDYHATRLATCSERLGELITSPRDTIDCAQLHDIFGDLNDFLVIPHYEKKPSIRQETLDKLRGHVFTGEVDSAKKFVRCYKDASRLVPTLFSDARMSEELTHFPTRATFIDCGDITLPAIKECLRDRNKVSLSEKDGNRLFQVLDDGLEISTGLNVLLGERSSGKTFTLDRIVEQQPDAKYIEQFSLVQTDEKKQEKEFNAELDRRRSLFAEDHLSKFKSVVDAISRIDLPSDERLLERFLETLLQSAENADRQDAFSKAALFSEATFKTGDDESLKTLIQAVRHLIENVDYREVISRHLELVSLKALACELIETLWTNTLNRSKREYVNAIVKDVRRGLGVRSSAVQVEDVDLYELAMNRKRVQRFEMMTKALQVESVVKEDVMQGFTVTAKRAPFAGAGELKAISGRKISFMDAWSLYESPYEFLRALISMESIPDAELYKYFAKIQYVVLNRDGFPVSGGERSEFRLLQEINDAQHYSMLLVDEPESSFDNTFLNTDVNSLIRDISKTMPVVIVTHNSTVGASIGADYVLYASKIFADRKVVYKIYSGYPSDKALFSKDGSEISNHRIMMDSLEAGEHAYESRRSKYEAIKD